MTDTRSPRDIEREIERDRANLTDTLDDLQDRFSVEGIARQVSDQFREHGGDISAAVSRSVKDNPMALALTGVGLAWLIFGDSKKHSGVRSRYSSNGYADDDYDRPDRGARIYGRDNLHGESRYGSPARASHHYDTRKTTPTAAHPSWVRSYDNPYADHSQSDDDSSGFADRARGVYDAAGNKLSDASDAMSEKSSSAANRASQMKADASSRARAMGRDMSDRAEAAKGSLRDTRDRASQRAAELRTRLSEGTETLSEEARARVIDARHRAMEARDSAIAYAQQGQRRAADMFEEQPLIGGAMALAVGAAIGAALPRTRAEDQYMGEHSDQLIHEAEQIFQEEKDKATEVAKAAMGEAKNIAGEAQKAATDAKKDADANAPADNAAQAAADKAKQAGQRVTDAARDKAEEEKLGQPSK